MIDQLKNLAYEIEQHIRIYDAKSNLLKLHNAAPENIPSSVKDVADDLATGSYQSICYAAYLNIYRDMLVKIDSLADMSEADCLAELYKYVYTNIVAHKQDLIDIKARLSYDGTFVSVDALTSVKPKEAFILSRISCFRHLITMTTRIFDDQSIS